MRRLPLLALLAGCAIYPDRDTMLEQALAAFDRDGDGSLDPAEFTGSGPVLDPGLRFEEYDADGDGRISPAELGATLDAREPRPIIDKRIPLDARGGVGLPFEARERPGRAP